MGSELRSSRTILGVPIKTELAPLLADPSRYLARSTVLMRDRANDQQFFFGGASVDTCPRTAEATSQYEVVERIFAMPALHRDKRSFPTFDYFRDVPSGTVTADEVLITEKRSLAGDERRTGTPATRGAVGLGLGSTLRQAKAHALFEAVERHLRASLWYRDSFVRQLAGEHLFGDRYLLRRYCADDVAIPFCLSVVTSEAEHGAVFYVGSAVRRTFAAACRKADHEALMMLDNHLAGRDGWANTEHSRLRFLGLSGPGTMPMRAHLESRVRGRGHIPDRRVHDEARIARAVLGPSQPARYSPLLQRDGLYLVRVLAPSLTWEQRERERRPASFVADPYC